MFSTFIANHDGQPVWPNESETTIIAASGTTALHCGARRRFSVALDHHVSSRHIGFLFYGLREVEECGVVARFDDAGTRA